MKKLSQSVKDFLNYSYKGNGKYYITEYGSQHFRNTLFYNFYRLNENCVKVLQEGNDAPRGGRVGDFYIVEFTEEFFTKFKFFFEEREKQREKQKEREAFNKEAEERVKHEVESCSPFVGKYRDEILESKTLEGKAKSDKQEWIMKNILADAGIVKATDFWKVWRGLRNVRRNIGTAYEDK